ncbi:MAG: isocitrate/isopropylmalate family dehydrogenase, partial [Gemmatimonadota bacterium]
MPPMIAVLPGDGIGPEVTAEAVRVLRAVGDFETREGLIGGAAIDRTGTSLPDETLNLCREADAVLLGADGGSQWKRPEEGLLNLRRELGLFANLRPVAPHPAVAHASPIKSELLTGVDLMFVRELTGGIYFGEKRRDDDSAE